MSEEILQAAGDLAYWQKRAESAERARDEDHARVAALIEACEAFADFALSYTPDSVLALEQPTFYGLLRVYGKNARAAVAVTRGYADAYTAELAAARAVVGTVRDWLRRPTSALPIDKPSMTAIGAIVEALNAYDRAVKEANE